MIIDSAHILATFTSPQTIGTEPTTLLYMFPLLLSTALIYKATKLPVIFLGKFIKEVLQVFCSISAVMIIAAVVLNIIVAVVTT